MCVYIILFLYYTISILLVFALFSMIIDYDYMSRAFLRRLWRPDNWVNLLFKKSWIPRQDGKCCGYLGIEYYRIS